jgi:hypothetical protein
MQGAHDRRNQIRAAGSISVRLRLQRFVKVPIAPPLN